MSFPWFSKILDLNPVENASDCLKKKACVDGESTYYSEFAKGSRQQIGKECIHLIPPHEGQRVKKELVIVIVIATWGLRGMAL